MTRSFGLRSVMGGTACLIALGGCAGWDPARGQKEQRQVDETIARFRDRDPGIKVFFDNAHGYAVFPNIGKGAVTIGGAFGKGQVYERGAHIGRATMTQITVGFQWGGQAYSEIIFFKDKTALERFKSDKLEFEAQASAVAVKAGASATAPYERGVAVFTLAKGGLMYEASIGGQRFSFEPK